MLLTVVTNRFFRARLIRFSTFGFIEKDQQNSSNRFCISDARKFFCSFTNSDPVLHVVCLDLRALSSPHILSAASHQACLTSRFGRF